VTDARIHAAGPRTSLMALAAAAADPAVDGARLSGSLGSLKEIIEQGQSVSQAPEQFCFGLLQTADIKQLVQIAAPREIQFAQPSDRAMHELAGLKAVYASHGTQFDPLAP
jgi:hypothetical protein